MGQSTKRLDYKERTQIHQVKNHHRSMARDIVAGGLQNKDIAKLYGMTESQISIIVNSPLFQAELARLEALADNAVIQVKTRMAQMIPKATEVLEQTLDEALMKDEAGKEKIILPSDADKRLGTKVALDIFDKILPRDAMVASGDTYNTQVNVDARNMTPEELRDSVFELCND